MNDKEFDEFEAKILACSQRLRPLFSAADIIVESGGLPADLSAALARESKLARALYARNNEFLVMRPNGVKRSEMLAEIEAAQARLGEALRLAQAAVDGLPN